MASNTIINSRLFRKIENSDEFFSISNLIEQIWKDIREDRKRIEDLLTKTLSDSEDLKEAIKEFNDIDKLPNITIFGDIPNKYLNNFTDNVQLQINLLNAVQRLQANWVKRNEPHGGGNNKNTNEDDWNISDVIDSDGVGSKSEDGLVHD